MAVPSTPFIFLVVHILQLRGFIWQKKSGIQHAFQE